MCIFYIQSLNNTSPLIPTPDFPLVCIGKFFHLCIKCITKNKLVYQCVSPKINLCISVYHQKKVCVSVCITKKNILYGLVQEMMVYGKGGSAGPRPTTMGNAGGFMMSA